MPCTWRCKHKGGCSLPCGAPCDRAPCNERCSRKLACGHRCPGLCGEKCPAMAYCVHEECKAKTPERVKGQVVDLIMMASFEDLTDAEVDSGPLVVLPCGHAFVISSLDGYMGMSDVYQQAEGQEGAWAAAKQLPDDRELLRPKTCPAGGCKVPVVGVRRYGRPINRALLALIEKKHAEACRRQTEDAFKLLATLADRIQQHQAAPSTSSTVMLNEALQLLAETFALAGRFAEVSTKEASPPNERVYETTVAALKRAEEQGYVSAEEAAQRRSILSIKPPDRTGFYRAVEGIGGSAQQALLATELALSSAVKVLGAIAGSSKTVQEVQSQIKGLVAQADQIFGGISQMLQHSAGAALEHACYNRSFILSLKLVQLHVRRVQQLQQTKSAKVAALLQQQQQPQQPRDMASSNSNGRGSNGSGSSVPAGWAARVEAEQLRLLEAAQKLGQQAVETHAPWAATDEGMPISAVDQIRELLQQLPEIKEQIKELGMEEVARLLATAMGLHGDTGMMNVASYMRGHVYQCPNGHIYVIGECGGAMQRGRCNECGARIGGQSHQLEGTNRPATEVLGQMEGVLGGR